MDNRPTDRVRREVSRAIRSRKIRLENARLLAVLAVFVVLAVAGITMQNGRAIVHEERVLDCPVAADGAVAHTHDDSCYDEEGRLVCQLPEVELHTHDDSCYTEERSLVCGLEEGEGAHYHDESCYDEEGNLICGLEESDGHVHTDDCYETTRTLTCGKEEVTEEHVHGQGCFRTVVMDDGEAEDDSVEDPEASDTEAVDEVVLPAQSFQHEFVDDEEQLQLRVSVEAPEGALPEGTTMRAEWVDTEADENGDVQAAIDDAVAKKTEGRIDSVQAVDITFLDADDAEVEPAVPVTVTMTSPQIADAAASSSASPLLVHVESEREAVERGQELGLAEVQIEGQVVDPLSEKQLAKRDIEAGKEDLVFDAEKFSVYAVVYTVDFHWEVDGKTFDFGIPGGDFVSIRNLVVALGVVADDPATDTNEVRELVDGIQCVEFSDPSLVSVSRVDADTTVGAIKGDLGLDIEYSADLTKEQIARINAQQVAGGDWALISLMPFDTEETLTVTMEDGEVWAVKVTDARISTMYLSDNGELFEVAVTYDEAANIPEGSTLKVTEFAENDADYEYARNSVLADKKAKGEYVDLSSFGLAALDISIQNSDGEEIEPAAPVQVEIKIKELPGVENLDEVAGTLAIQHHVEVKDGVVVETVFDGGAEASFELATDETVAAEGTAVDPNSVSEADFVLPKALSSDSTRVVDIDVSFQTPAFSTFTVTWGTPASENDRSNLNGKSFHLVNGSHSVALVAENTNNNTRLRAVQYSSSDDSITKWYFQRVSNNDWYFYITDGNGHYLNIGNGNNSYVRVSETPQPIYVNQNNNGLFRLQRSNQSSSTAVNLYGGNASGNFGPYNDRGENEWFRAYYPQTGDKVTIRYVDESGTELNVSNTISLSTDNAAETYLIYDIDGYEYDSCYLNNDKSNSIQPYLGYDGRYYYLPNPRDGYGYYLQNNSVINVVYKKKNTPTKGGVPLVDRTSEQADPPTVLKSSVDNGDGTNTLSLSIAGSQAPAKLVKLADIIVIFDRSGSMNFNMAGDLVQQYGTTYRYWDANSRIKQAYDALNTFAEDMLSKTNSAGEPLVRMSLISFSDTAKVESGFTSDKDTLMSAVQQLVGNGGTNWEHALQLANSEFRLAADENNVGSMELDPNRATFVVFITDGQPTFRMTRYDVRNNEFDEDDESSRDISSEDYFRYHVFGPGNDDHHGRNYDAALREASSIVKNDKILYSIGISGDEKELDNLDDLVSQAGAGENHSVVATNQAKLVEAFEDIAERITGYTGQADIKMYDGITGLTNTISKVNQTDNNRLLGVDGDFTYWKSSVPEGWKDWSDEQKSAYVEGMDYANSSSTPTGYENWSAEQKAAFQAGKNATYTEWTTREADGCAAAEYNTETGAVEWNMGESFMLEDGIIYKVSFTCWPSQEAYDILAKLNNGTITFGDTELYSNEVWDQFEGDASSGYTLKTNAEGANTTYRKAANVDGTLTVDDKTETLPFQHVPPMPLTKEDINVAKTWQASRIDTQDPESVVMQVVGDDELYKQFVITPTEKRDGSTTNNWGQSDDIFISCGHLKVDKTTGAVVVYESGHDFTLREVEENSRHWDLDASVCRPMKINNQATMLVLVEGDDVPAAMTSDASLGYCTSGGDEYYRVDGKVYKDTKAWADITGMNTRRSFLDMAKEVLVDNEVWTESVDTKFTYKIKIDIDPTTLSWDPDLEKYIIISVRGDGYTPAGAIADTTYPTTAKLPTQSGMPSSLIHEGYDSQYLVAESGVEFYLSIKNGWSVRFLNLPAGTTYSIEEVIGEDSDYRFKNARLETRKDKDSANPDTTQTFTQKKLEGTISETSTLYKAVYQNEAKEQHVKILKVSQDTSTSLSGAQFNLYTESAYKSQPKGTPLKENLVSSDESATKGQVDLDTLPVGKYYLVETSAPAGYIPLSEPVEITVAADTVTYSQKGNNLSQSNQGVSYDQEAGTYTLTVTNNAGVALPHTGGPGTALLYLVGAVLVAGAVGVLLRDKRTTS